MEYSKIVAVTGIPGLYEILSSKSDGAVVRSLEDGSTKFISARVHNLSHLESIEVYTTGENVTLSDIFQAIKNNGEQLPDVKDNKALKQYFEKVYPELDLERVYTSDMKKMINWYKLLDKHGIDYTAKREGSDDNTPEGAEQFNPEEEKVVLETNESTVPEEGKVKTKRKSTKSTKA